MAMTGGDLLDPPIQDLRETLCAKYPQTVPREYLDSHVRKNVPVRGAELVQALTWQIIMEAARRTDRPRPDKYLPLAAAHALIHFELYPANLNDEIPGIGVAAKTLTFVNEKTNRTERVFTNKFDPVTRASDRKAIAAVLGNFGFSTTAIALTKPSSALIARAVWVEVNEIISDKKLLAKLMSEAEKDYEEELVNAESVRLEPRGAGAEATFEAQSSLAQGWFSTDSKKQYVIVSRACGLALDNDTSHDAGVWALLWPLHGLSHQRWNVFKLGERDDFVIRSVDSGLVLTASIDSEGDQRLTQEKLGKDKAIQRWQLEAGGIDDLSFSITSSHTQRSLEVSKDSGNREFPWYSDEKGREECQWLILPVGLGPDGLAISVS